MRRQLWNRCKNSAPHKSKTLCPKPCELTKCRVVLQNKLISAQQNKALRTQGLYFISITRSYTDDPIQKM